MAQRNSMEPLDRRNFLGATLGGLAATLAFGSAFTGANSAEAAAALFGPTGYDPNTLFLTWQQDPTTTITIQWIGPETAADRSILWRPATLAPKEKAETDGTAAVIAQPPQGITRIGKTIVKPYPNTKHVVHRCELTGLTPGGEYEFQIGLDSPTYRFRTMPAKATDTIQFVSGGDSGVGKHALATNRLAALQDPRFVFIGGDLAYDNGESPKTFTQFLQNYRRQLVDSEGRLIPLISCIGNHEVVNHYRAKRSQSPQYLSVFDGLFAQRTYNVLDVGDYLSLVLLDTNHIEPVVGEQTSWLEKTLAERQDRPHLIVANHVPAYPSYRDPEPHDGDAGTGEDQRKHWSPLFEKYKVDVVLEHHDHTFKRTHPLTDGHVDKHGVLYLGDGSWGKLRPPHAPENRPYLATVAEAYHMTVHRLEGEAQYHVALQDTGKVADTCVTYSKRPSKRG